VSFLAPAFLAGLLALAVPILVHLIHREKQETVPFPSLMFLHRIPFRSVRRQKLRHLLLFAMRCLAFVLLALAFARPFFDAPGEALTALAGARERVILLDRSYSMGYGDRWRRAQEAARKAALGLGSDDRASLVLFSAGAEVVERETSDRARLLSTIDAATPGSGVTRYGPALKLAEELIAASTRPRREVELITDFQRAGWEGHEDVRLPEGTTLTWVDLSERETSNVAVTDVVLQREYAAGRERVAVSARLANKGPRPVRELPVSLELDGRSLGEQRANLEANGTATVAFAAFALPTGLARGTLRAAPDALARDDVFHFVLGPGRDVSVLLVESGSGRASRSLYLARALSIGDRPRFRAEVKSAAQLAPEDFAGRSAVILNDAPFPAGAAGARLKDLVAKGGGLLVVLGEQSSAAAWDAEAQALLPGAVGPTVDRASDWGGTLSYLDYGHPVFELFRAPRSGDFSSARFFRYRSLKMEGAEGVLARFDDGTIALSEKKLGEGRVLVWTSTIDTFWNDLPLKPIFLPFVHQLMKHAAGHADARSWRTVGEVLELGGTAARLASLPSGRKRPLAAGERFLTLDEQGFYELRPLGAGAERSELIAVNLDPRESDLASIDPEELAGAITRRGAAAAPGGPTSVVSAVDRERRQALWWYLLAAALVLLALETVLSNRLSHLPR
jgi:hypothetical protein